MKKGFAIFLILVVVGLSFFFAINQSRTLISGAPPYQVADNPPSDGELDDFLQDWTRPEGPAKVALQVGHWKNNEVPEELKNLRGNTGASGGGKAEWEVNYEIALLTKENLEKRGVAVELLPATIPEKYWADVFIAIHADGSEDLQKKGFKAAIPRRDLTGNADELLTYVENSYQVATGLIKDPNVTRNMRGYYAFGWWRYDHAVHPMTTSLILETGFLTNYSDRLTIVEKPEVSAEGLSNGILEYLAAQKILNQ